MECHLIMMERKCILLMLTSYDDIDEYSLSTAFDVSSASYSQRLYVEIEKIILMECHLITMEQKCLL